MNRLFGLSVDPFKNYWDFGDKQGKKTFLTEYIYDPKIRRESRAVV